MRSIHYPILVIKYASMISFKRIDAARGLLEDAEFRDEPLSGLSDNPNDYKYTKHIYTWDLPETRSLLTHFYRAIKVY